MRQHIYWHYIIVWNLNQIKDSLFFQHVKHFNNKYKCFNQSIKRERDCMMIINQAYLRARQEVVDLGCWSCGRVSEVGDIVDRQNLRELCPTSIQPWWLPFGSNRAARFTSFFALLYSAIQLFGFLVVLLFFSGSTQEVYFCI